MSVCVFVRFALLCFFSSHFYLQPLLKYIAHLSADHLFKAQFTTIDLMHFICVLLCISLRRQSGILSCFMFPTFISALISTNSIIQNDRTKKKNEPNQIMNIRTCKRRITEQKKMPNKHTKRKNGQWN